MKKEFEFSERVRVGAAVMGAFNADPVQNPGDFVNKFVEYFFAKTGNINWNDMTNMFSDRVKEVNRVGWTRCFTLDEMHCAACACALVEELRSFRARGGSIAFIDPKEE